MGKFVQGVKSLFTGEETDAMRQAREAQEKQSATAREQQNIALARQQQQLQNEQLEADANVRRASRMPRGRRLLLAATGERGVSTRLGG